jgi:hypothetical protein
MRGSRRNRLAKAPDFELDDDIADILSMPAEKEHLFLDAIRKAGGAEDVVKCAAAVARSAQAIRDAFDGEIPVEVQKAMDDAVGEIGLPRTEAPPSKKKKVTVSPKPEDPDMLADAAEEGFDEVLKGIEIATDATAARRLDEAAIRIAKANPDLTKEKAYALAVEQNANDYEGYRRHTLRERGQLNDSPPTLRERREEMRKAREGIGSLDDVARRLRESDPSLSEAQSIAKALDLHPELYET